MMPPDSFSFIPSNSSPRRIRMADVAERAGVHQTTVSLALRDHPRLPVATREKIQRIAREMGYAPDPALSALAAYRDRSRVQKGTQVIGMLLDESDGRDLRSSHSYERLLAGAHQRAGELGFKIENFWYGKDYKTACALNRVLRTRNIQGLILASIHIGAETLTLDWDAFSVVKINFRPAALRFDSVLINHMLVVRLAMRRLRKLGYHRIGLAVSDADEDKLSNLFLCGYLVGQRHFSMADRIPAYIFPAGDSLSIREGARSWALENRPDAILSNWNNLDKVAWDLTVNENMPCRFVPLDADWRTGYYGGVIQPHEVCGARAVDTLVGQLRTFRLGTHVSPATLLLNPLWKELAPWPPPSLVPLDKKRVPAWAREYEESVPPPAEETEWSSLDSFS